MRLSAEKLGSDDFTLAFENVGGRIEAAIEQLGWVDKLSEHERTMLVAALRGLLDMAAVDRVDGQERIESPTPLGPGLADLARRVSWSEWVERWNLTAHPAEVSQEKSP